MPTYEYVCESCGHEFERFQKMSDDAVRECPECGRLEVRRRISTGGGVLFKGPGFYATDYRKPSPGDEKKRKTERKAEPKTEPKAERKTERKAERKTEPKTEPKPKPDPGGSGSKGGDTSGD